MFKILVVEDDERLLKLMSAVLRKNGYDALTAPNGVEALEVMDQNHIDLIISDIMMPKMDGYQFTRQLREGGYTQPILMVTAKDDFDAKLRGFTAGTDDYMVKPIDLNEMILRVGALLRRSQIASEHRIEVGDMLLNYDSFTVRWRGEEMMLPKKEFLLLYKLLSYPGRIFTRQQLMDELWGFDSTADERTVDVHIKRLRERFHDNNAFEIVTVRGLGYKAVKS
ncbi:MAG: response regulator transcription factor [Clostridiales bacterium]|nr:response regulator transcription factor [Clostridiales bacterium]MBQ2818119.1 response regulator transcription factor [Clostridia bacterium]